MENNPKKRRNDEDIGNEIKRRRHESTPEPNEEIQEEIESWSLLSPAAARRAREYHAARKPRIRSPRTLHSFSDLPLEIAQKILKHAFPKARVVDLDFYIVESNGWRSRRRMNLKCTLVIKAPRFPAMHPFLGACKISYFEAYRNMDKVEVHPLGSRSSRARSIAEDINPDADVRYVIDPPSEGQNKKRYTYIRPAKDLLLTNARELLRLYRHGGFIDSKNIRQLAVHDEHTQFFSRNSKLLPRTLQHVALHYPKLQTFNLVMGPGKSELFPHFEAKFLSMDDVDWRGADFLTFHGTPHKWSIPGDRRVENLLGQADYLRQQFNKFLRQHEKNDKVDFDEARNYWQSGKIEPVVGVMCCLDEDKNWKSYEERKGPEYKVWVEAIDVWLPAHADGTILDKYKGLAQIFDGAPW